MRRVKRRAKCWRCPKIIEGTYSDRPLCQGCRRELMGLPRDGSATRSEYWKVHHKRRVAAAKAEMSERINVSFTRPEYEAALARLRQPTEGGRDKLGAPSLDVMDLEDAVRRMERADRPLKIVS